MSAALLIILREQIPSGKGQARKVWVPKTRTMRWISNRRFEKWRAAASQELMLQRAEWPTEVRVRLPLQQPVKAVISYRPLDCRTRDLPGMQDALWHLLGYMGIVKDDKWIHAVEWQYPHRKEGPCVQLRLEVL